MQETGGAELLYKNALIDPYRNYLNEPYIIRSYPLIEKVVNDLNFNSIFYKEGYFMTTEAYDYMPVRAVWCDPQETRLGQFIFTLKDTSHYSLSWYSDNNDDKEETTVFALDDSIHFQEFKLCIRNIPGREIKKFVGVPFLLSIQNPRTVASSYIDRLGVEWAEEGSGVINLTLTGTNPQKEIDFLEGLVNTYQEMDLRKKK
jgi:hypothetical protein